jgi:hypothetical protein
MESVPMNLHSPYSDTNIVKETSTPKDHQELNNFHHLKQT